MSLQLSSRALLIVAVALMHSANSFGEEETCSNEDVQLCSGQDPSCLRPPSLVQLKRRLLAPESQAPQGALLRESLPTVISNDTIPTAQMMDSNASRENLSTAPFRAVAGDSRRLSNDVDMSEVHENPSLQIQDFNASHENLSTAPLVAVAGDSRQASDDVDISQEHENPSLQIQDFNASRENLSTAPLGAVAGDSRQASDDVDISEVHENPSLQIQDFNASHENSSTAPLGTVAGDSRQASDDVIISEVHEKPSLQIHDFNASRESSNLSTAPWSRVAGDSRQEFDEDNISTVHEEELYERDARINFSFNGSLEETDALRKARIHHQRRLEKLGALLTANNLALSHEKAQQLLRGVATMSEDLHVKLNVSQLAAVNDTAGMNVTDRTQETVQAKPKEKPKQKLNVKGQKKTDQANEDAEMDDLQGELELDYRNKGKRQRNSIWARWGVHPVQFIGFCFLVVMFTCWFTKIYREHNDNTW